MLIIAAAASPALTLWANNDADVPKIHRIILVACGFAILGVGVFWALRQLFLDSRLAAFVTFFVVLALTSGGRVMEESPWALRWVVAIAAVAVAAAIVHRLRDLWLLDAVVVASAVALLVPPILSGTWAGLTNAEQENPPSIPVTVPIMVEHPDVVLVVVDGYTSLPVLRELFGFEDISLSDDLGRAGFDVMEPLFSPYPMTHLTVSSLLELDYVAEDAPRTATKDGRPLAQVIGGDSYLVQLLAQSGYRITMVESGWHMSICGEKVDVCVTDRFIDEGVGAVLSQSLFWSFLEPSVGSAFTHGARHAMAWTAENIGGLVSDARSDFIFVHVLAPHPPLFLDGACEVVSDGRLTGMALSVAGVAPETAQARRDGYVNQVRCVNRFLRDLTNAVSDSDALVFITGDHGSDAMSQLVTDPEQWSEPQVLERMSVFLTVKPTPGCDDLSSLVTVVLLRMLVSCAGDLGLDPIEEKSYLLSLVDDEPANMRTLRADQMEMLAHCLAKLDETLECS